MENENYSEEFENEETNDDWEPEEEDDGMQAEEEEGDEKVVPAENDDDDDDDDLLLDDDEEPEEGLSIPIKIKDGNKTIEKNMTRDEIGQALSNIQEFKEAHNFIVENVEFMKAYYDMIHGQATGASFKIVSDFYNYALDLHNQQRGDISSLPIEEQNRLKEKFNNQQVLQERKRAENAEKQLAFQRQSDNNYEQSMEDLATAIANYNSKSKDYEINDDVMKNDAVRERYKKVIRQYAPEFYKATQLKKADSPDDFKLNPAQIRIIVDGVYSKTIYKKLMNKQNNKNIGTVSKSAHAKGKEALDNIKKEKPAAANIKNIPSNIKTNNKPVSIRDLQSENVRKLFR
jgi:hypothetical protein